MRLIDETVLRIREHAASISWSKIAAQAALEVASVSRMRCPPPAQELAGEAATHYLEVIVPVVQEEILRYHRAYGSVQWLWYLRRAPKEFFAGGYGTTFAYDRTLAEMVSWYQPQTGGPVNASMVAFKTNESAFRQLCRYVGRIKFLSQLHILYRRIGKGAVLDLASPVLVANNDDEIERAIALYDKRHDRSYHFAAGGLGLATLEADASKVESVFQFDDPAVCLVFALDEPVLTPIVFPKDGELAEAEVDAWHALKVTRVERMLDPFSEGANALPPYASELAPVIQLLILLPLMFLRFPWALAGTVQQGYFFAREDSLRSMFAEILPQLCEVLRQRSQLVAWPQTYEEWLHGIEQLTPSLWPLRAGGILRRLHTNLLIDVTTASTVLLQRLEMSRSPTLGNVRAGAFERQCQQLIDRSGWRPPEEIGRLRGKTLRRAGVALTDVDAIGVRDGKLLLVSCKSLIYDSEYDKGTFRVVRNAQSTIDRAVVQWDEIVADIAANRVGDNFDFSRFTEVYGVVCTPFVVYSSASRTTRLMIGDLPASVSSAELDDWLAR